MSDSSKRNDFWIYTGLVLAAFAVPCIVPLVITTIAWASDIPMRLNLVEALFVTFGVFIVWFLLSEVFDSLVLKIDPAGNLTNKSVSLALSLAVLTIGYWTIVESIMMATVLAGLVCGSLFALSPIIDHWYEARPSDGNGTGTQADT